jgi:hypothetical protein
MSESQPALCRASPPLWSIKVDVKHGVDFSMADPFVEAAKAKRGQAVPAPAAVIGNPWGERRELDEIDKTANG